MKRTTQTLLAPRQLQAIAAVARAGSVHAAARALGIPQPALSRLVATAERTLGSALFERSRSGTRLTEAGARVVKQICFALQALEGVSEVARNSLPVLRLGCIPRVMETLVPHLLAQLSSGDAGFRLHITVGTSNELVAELAAAHLDFVIARRMVLTEDDSPVVAERLYSEKTVVVCGLHNMLVPDSICPISKLAQLSWVLPKRGFYSRDTLDAMLSEFGLPPIVPIIESNSFESSLSVVAATPFLAMAPEFAARRFALLNLVRIVHTKPSLGSSPVMLQYRPGQEAHPAFPAFRIAVTKAGRLVPTIWHGESAVMPRLSSAPSRRRPR